MEDGVVVKLQFVLGMGKSEFMSCGCALFPFFAGRSTVDMQV